MTQLKINRFIDISNVTKVDLKKVLRQYIQADRIEETTLKIMSEIEDYVQIARDLELFENSIR